MKNEMINTKATLELTGIRSANTLRSYWKGNNFPQPIRATIGANGKLYWYKHEVEAWIESRRGVTDEVA